MIQIGSRVTGHDFNHKGSRKKKEPTEMYRSPKLLSFVSGVKYPFNDEFSSNLKKI